LRAKEGQVGKASENLWNAIRYEVYYESVLSLIVTGNVVVLGIWKVHDAPHVGLSTWMSLAWSTASLANHTVREIAESSTGLTCSWKWIGIWLMKYAEIFQRLFVSGLIVVLFNVRQPRTVYLFLFLLTFITHYDHFLESWKLFLVLPCCGRDKRHVEQPEGDEEQPGVINLVISPMTNVNNMMENTPDRLETLLGNNERRVTEQAEFVSDVNLNKNNVSDVDSIVSCTYEDITAKIIRQRVHRLFLKARQIKFLWQSKLTFLFSLRLSSFCGKLLSAQDVSN